MSLFKSVWFLESGHVIDGKFIAIKQGSSILITIKRESAKLADSPPERVLLTVLHTVVEGNCVQDVVPGEYHTAFRAWRAGAVKIAQTASHLSIHPEFANGRQLPFSHSEDVSVLRFDNGRPAEDPTRLIPDAKCCPTLQPLEISGYSNGHNCLDANSMTLQHARSKQWEYTSFDLRLENGILQGGTNPPEAGSSGGAVIYKRRVAGMYRGRHPHIDAHLFMPSKLINSWLAGRKFAIVPPPLIRPMTTQLLVVTSIIALGMLWFALEASFIPITCQTHSSSALADLQLRWHKHNLHIFKKSDNSTILASKPPALIRCYQKITLIPGTISIDYLVKVERGGTLVIPPGTTLEFSKSAGLQVEGALHAVGRRAADSRITLQAQASSKEWMGISFIGAGTSGSKLAWCTILDGRGHAYAFSQKANELTLQGSTYTPPPNPLTPNGLRAGGAVSIVDAETISLHECQFSGNAAVAGGAVYIYASKDVNFIGCTFNNNLSFCDAASITDREEPGRTRRAAPGGAVFIQNSSGLRFDQCAFVGNRALGKFSCGGALYAGFWASCDIRNCTFENNIASHVGGAFYGISLIPSYKGMEQSTWSENNWRPKIEISDCNFTNNRSLSFLRDPSSPWALHGSEIVVDMGMKVDLERSTIRNTVANTDVYVPPQGNSRGASVGRIVQADDQKTPDSFDSRRTLLSIKETKFETSFAEMAETDFLPSATASELSVSRDIRIWKPISSQPQPSGLLGISNKLALPKEIILDGKPTRYYTERPNGSTIDSVVIHHASAVNWDQEGSGIRASIKEEMDGAPNQPEGNDRVFSPALTQAIFRSYGVSCHYMIDREGRIFQLVAENKIAFHAGKSQMPEPDSRQNVNDFSIGIELLAVHPDNYARLPNPDTGAAYTSAQYESLLELIHSVTSRHPIRQIVGHDEISGVSAQAKGLKRADPKSDPGPEFDWSKVRHDNRSPKLPR